MKYFTLGLVLASSLALGSVAQARDWSRSDDYRRHDDRRESRHAHYDRGYGGHDRYRREVVVRRYDAPQCEDRSYYSRREYYRPYHHPLFSFFLGR